MPTDNPKVSAYVPQYIFDCFKAFYEERGISMSQAVTLIFSEYFQLKLPEAKDDSSLPSGLLTDRLVMLEEKMASLSSSQSELSSRLLIEIDSLVNRLADLEYRLVDKTPFVQSDTNIQNDSGHKQLTLVDIDQYSGEPQNHEIEELPNELLSELPNELPNELPSDISLLKPVIGRVLAHRLGISSSTLSNNKKRMPKNEFYSWLQSRDPDRILWEPTKVSEKYPKGYLPSSGTPSELLTKLKDWLKKNNL